VSSSRPIIFAIWAMAVRGIMLGFSLLATPDYGRAQQITAPAEKSAGRRSFVVIQKISDVERLESSSRRAVVSDGSQAASPDTFRL